MYIYNNYFYNPKISQNINLHLINNNEQFMRSFLNIKTIKDSKFNKKIKLQMQQL
jgi:hypothetical protein